MALLEGWLWLQDSWGGLSLPRRRKEGGYLGYQRLGKISNRFWILFMQTFFFFFSFVQTFKTNHRWGRSK